MERTYIANLPADQVSRASGFVDTIRQMKWGAFVVLRDTTGKIQVTVDKATIPEIVTVTPHSVLSVVGTVKENPSVPGHGLM